MLKVGPKFFLGPDSKCKVGIRLPLDAWWVISIIHHYKLLCVGYLVAPPCAYLFHSCHNDTHLLP
jgi:hypothetical protein